MVELMESQGMSNSFDGTQYPEERKQLAKVRHVHDQMIDFIIATPGCKQADLCREFNYTPPWISRIMSSDSFQAALSKRREEIVDPVLVRSMQEQLQGLMQTSVDILVEKLDATKNPQLALSTLELTQKALGFGARQAPMTNVQFVVALPPKVDNPEEWAQQAREGRIIDVPAQEITNG